MNWQISAFFKPGRFSTDLDFTGLGEHDHEDVILTMMGAFEEEFHGIRFRIPDNYYETVDGLSWGVNPTYAHEWTLVVVGALIAASMPRLFLLCAQLCDLQALAVEIEPETCNR
jgi:hypothetical protein